MNLKPHGFRLSPCFILKSSRGSVWRLPASLMVEGGCREPISEHTQLCGSVRSGSHRGSLPFYPHWASHSWSSKTSDVCGRKKLREAFRWSPAVGQLADCFFHLRTEDESFAPGQLVFHDASAVGESEVLLNTLTGFLHSSNTLLYGFDLCRAMLGSELFSICVILLL